MFYSHGVINNNNNNNITGGLCHFWYERVYFFLPSVLSNARRETQIIRAYGNHTMLTSPAQRSAHLLVSKISTDLCQSEPKLIWSDPKNSTTRFDGRTSAPVFFKIQKFSGPSLTGVTSSTHPIHSNGTSSPISCLGVYYDRWWLWYPFRTGVCVQAWLWHQN